MDTFGCGELAAVERWGDVLFVHESFSEDILSALCLQRLVTVSADATMFCHVSVATSFILLAGLALIRCPAGQVALHSLLPE